MDLKQIQITYQLAEDRLLLRLSGGERDEFRFWLTRRLVSVIAEPLRKHLKGQSLNPDGAEPPKPAEESARADAEAAFEHERIMAGLKTEKRFDEPDERRMPLGETPLLVAKLRLTPGKSGGLLLSLYSDQNQGLDIQLGPPLVHGFCDLLVKSSNQAGWGLSLGLVPQIGTADPASKAFH
ncbi:MAG: hypothetical protein P1U54_04670 [Immundisolibacteraceae bacterium]|nr:hypothetical protein [Immundisolibacteraceae bacterium]